MLPGRLARLAQVLIFVCVCFCKQEEWPACRELDSIIGLQLTSYVGLNSKMVDQGQKKKNVFYCLQFYTVPIEKKKSDF